MILFWYQLGSILVSKIHPNHIKIRSWRASFFILILASIFSRCWFVFGGLLGAMLALFSAKHRWRRLKKRDEKGRKRQQRTQTPPRRLQTSVFECFYAHGRPQDASRPRSGILLDGFWIDFDCFWMNFWFIFQWFLILKHTFQKSNYLKKMKTLQRNTSKTSVFSVRHYFWTRSSIRCFQYRILAVAGSQLHFMLYIYRHIYCMYNVQPASSN